MPPAFGSIDSSTTGVLPITQTSATAPPLRMAMAVGSLDVPMRAKPPGMTAHPVGVRARNMRTLIGRGTNLPSA